MIARSTPTLREAVIACREKIEAVSHVPGGTLDQDCLRLLGLVDAALTPDNIEQTYSEDEVIDIINIVTDLNKLDALDKALPEIASRLDRIIARTVAEKVMGDPRLIADLKALRQHHEFTRDRIGQPGCPVRRKAAEYVETIDATLAALEAERGAA